jgi:mannose-1-phosphate guanylyltransferase/phosphomannomutase
MRGLVEHLADQETVLVDGVKVVEEGGWALVLPDPEEPVTHVWAEATTAEGAEARAGQYAALIIELLD